jgi:hypothetical protein
MPRRGGRATEDDFYDQDELEAEKAAKAATAAQAAGPAAAAGPEAAAGPAAAAGPEAATATEAKTHGVFFFDIDGCLGTDAYQKEWETTKANDGFPSPASKEAHMLDWLKKSQSFDKIIEKIETLAETNHYASITIISGSNRQTDAAEESNAVRKGPGKPILQALLTANLTAKLPASTTDNIPVTFDHRRLQELGISTLLESSPLTEPAIYEGQVKAAHLCTFIDFIASEHPKETIDCHFLDDIYANNLQKDNPQAGVPNYLSHEDLPNNARLTCHQVQSFCETEAESTTHRQAGYTLTKDQGRFYADQPIYKAQTALIQGSAPVKKKQFFKKNKKNKKTYQDFCTIFKNKPFFPQGAAQKKRFTPDRMPERPAAGTGAAARPAAGTGGAAAPRSKIARLKARAAVLGRRYLIRKKAQVHPTKSSGPTH